MRSRRERKVPERLEAGPATSKWSSGTAGNSAEKAPSARSREAEKGAAQPVAKKHLSGYRKSPRPAATRAAGTAENKRGPTPATGDSGQKQRRAGTKRTSYGAPSRTEAANDDEEADREAKSMSGETDEDEDQESDGHQQEDSDPGVDDATAKATRGVATNGQADQADAEAKGSGKGSRGKSHLTRHTTRAASTVEPADSENERDSEGRSSDSSEDSNANVNAHISSDSEELNASGRKTAKKPRTLQNPGGQAPSAGVALKSPTVFLHHSRTANNQERLMAEAGRPESSDSGGAVRVPSARAPPRKFSTLAALASSIPTATAAPASAAAIKSAASAAQAARAAAQAAQAVTAAAAPNAVNDTDKQREAKAAAAVDALLRNPIHQRPWSKIEHARFLNAMHFYHRDWRRIAQHVGHNRTAADVRTHSQIWNSRSTAYGDGVLVPVEKDNMGKDIKKKGVPTKRLEPMHTPVPHAHDGTRAHLGGATPTTVLESALKQVTFTAILPGINSVVEESTKALEEEWADKAEADRTQEEEEMATMEHNKRQTDDVIIKTNPAPAATAATDEPVAATPKQNSTLNQEQVQMQKLEELRQRVASNPMQLHLYRAMRFYSQLTPADKLKERRYAGLGLGKTTQHGRSDRNPGGIHSHQHQHQHQSLDPHPARQRHDSQHQQQQATMDWQTAAKVREQCPRCGPNGIDGVPCVCRHALLGARAHSLPPPLTLMSLLPKLPHKRLMVLPALKPDGDETHRTTKVVSHDDPRLSGTSKHLRTLLQCAGQFKKRKLDSDPAARWRNSLDRGLASVPPGLEHRPHPPSGATMSAATDASEDIAATASGGTSTERATAGSSYRDDPSIIPGNHSDDQDTDSASCADETRSAASATAATSPTNPSSTAASQPGEKTAPATQGQPDSASASTTADDDL